MFDPAAMGTLLIGLNGTDDPNRPQRRRHARHVRHRAHGGIRVAVAHALRRAATLVEGPAVCEPAA
jgi:hypothetical protein